MGTLSLAWMDIIKQSKPEKKSILTGIGDDVLLVALKVLAKGVL